MKLTSSVQCPDADCNGIFYDMLKREGTCRADVTLDVTCRTCEKKREITVEPDEAEEVEREEI